MAITIADPLKQLQQRCVEYLDRMMLCVIIVSLFGVQNYFVSLHPEFSIVLAIFSAGAVGMSYVTQRYAPQYRLLYGLTLVLSLFSNGYFFYRWVLGIVMLHQGLMGTLVQISHAPWPFALLGVALLSVLNLGTEVLRYSLHTHEILPFQKTLRLSRDKTLGSATLLYGKALQPMVNCSGLLVGQLDARAQSPLVRVKMEGHALTIAPPRSGKFTATLSALMACVSNLDENNPIVSVEPKGQAYCVWGRRRAALGRRVARVDPFNVIATLGRECDAQRAAQGKTPNFAHLYAASSDAFNPLDFIPNDSRMVQGIDALLEAFIPHIAGSNATELHFNQSARRILAGFIAWVCVIEPPECRHLPRVYDLLNQPEDELNHLLDEMMSSPLGFNMPRDAGTLMQNVAHEERGSYFSTTTNAIAWLKYPEMRAHLTHSTFSLEELAENTLDIFVIVPPHLLDMLRTWVRLWVTLPLHLVALKRPKKRIIMAIDELKALGYIKPLSNAYNLTSGYGVSIWSCTQALSDIEEIYGEKGAKSMITCSQIIQFFNISPADLTTQNYVSNIIGDTTVLTRGTSEGSSSGVGLRGFASSNSNRSLQETKQRLITSDEMAHLPDNSQLLFLRHSKSLSKPIYCYKALYFQRAEFVGYADPDPYHVLEQE